VAVPALLPRGEEEEDECKAAGLSARANDDDDDDDEEGVGEEEEEEACQQAVHTYRNNLQRQWRTRERLLAKEEGDEEEEEEDDDDDDDDEEEGDSDDSEESDESDDDFGDADDGADDDAPPVRFRKMSWEEEMDRQEEARQKRLCGMWGDPTIRTFNTRGLHYVTRGHPEAGKKFPCAGMLSTLLHPNQLIAVPTFDDRQYDNVLSRFPSVYRLYRALDAKRRAVLTQTASTKLSALLEAQQQARAAGEQAAEAAVAAVASANQADAAAAAEATKAASLTAEKLAGEVMRERANIERWSQPAFLFAVNLQIPGSGGPHPPCALFGVFAIDPPPRFTPVADGTAGGQQGYLLADVTSSSEAEPAPMRKVTAAGQAACFARRFAVSPQLTAPLPPPPAFPTAVASAARPLPPSSLARCSGASAKQTAMATSSATRASR
jgi:hypothetical protein